MQFHRNRVVVVFEFRRGLRGHEILKKMQDEMWRLGVLPIVRPHRQRRLSQHRIAGIAELRERHLRQRIDAGRIRVLAGRRPRRG